MVGIFIYGPVTPTAMIAVYLVLIFRVKIKMAAARKSNCLIVCSGAHQGLFVFEFVVLMDANISFSKKV